MQALVIENQSETQAAGNPAAGAALPSGCLNPPATNRERFLSACACRAVDRPPVWLMRQAGRALPEYRALKEKHSFLELVRTPELAAEVTLQPVRRFDFDAAILFSDILVVCEALGQSYRFRETGGIEMEFKLESARDIERLQTEGICERLSYTTKALELIRNDLGRNTALLGFAGSPWTLANFMLEGGSAREFTRAKSLLYSNPGLFCSLMEKLTAAIIEFLRMQVEAGVDAIQIFDSLGGLLAGNAFEMSSAAWIRQIIDSLSGQVPVIVFAKGAHENWEALVNTGAHVLGVDWTVPLGRVARRLPADIAVQGNLDPALLTMSPDIVATETGRVLREMRGRPGYIFNLGHGVPPNARLDALESVVTTVRNFT